MFSSVKISGLIMTVYLFINTALLGLRTNYTILLLNYVITEELKGSGMNEKFKAIVWKKYKTIVWMNCVKAGDRSLYGSVICRIENMTDIKEMLISDI